MSMKTFSEREKALLLCLFALFLIALWQALLSLVSGSVFVISGSFLPWRLVAYSLLAYPSATSHSKKRERAIAFQARILLSFGRAFSPQRLPVEWKFPWLAPAECRAGCSFPVLFLFKLECFFGKENTKIERIGSYDMNSSVTSYFKSLFYVLFL